MPEPLALELYHSIIHQVDDKSDLRSLALCCSAFRDEAQRCLFRHVDLKSMTQQRQQQLFISTVNSAPLRFGPLVHTFCIDQTWWNNHDSAMSLSTALRAMCELKDLELLWARPSTILRGCSFTLRSFVMKYSAVGKNEVVFLFRHFLPTQSRINRLELMLNRQIDDVDAPMKLCPHLDSLGVQTDGLVSVFLPESRLIPHFQWHRYSTPPPLTIHQLNHLKSLLFISGMDTTFTQHLTSLVYLEIILSIGNVNHHQSELLFLHNIPHLQVLILDTDKSPFPMSDDEFHADFSVGFRVAFELCPHLKYIDVGRDDSKSGWQRFIRPTNGEHDDLVWERQIVPQADIRAWRL